MSTAPANEAPDSLQPPAFAPEASVGPLAGSRPKPFGIPFPWDLLPAGRRTLAGWIFAFILVALFPLVDSNGGDLDGFANAGTFVLLALGLNVVVGFAGLLDLGYAAFFALGAYTYGLAASFQLKIPWSVLWVPFAWLNQVSEVHFGNGDVAQLHFSYWIMLPVAALVCAGFARRDGCGDVHVGCSSRLLGRCALVSRDGCRTDSRGAFTRFRTAATPPRPMRIGFGVGRADLRGGRERLARASTPAAPRG